LAQQKPLRDSGSPKPHVAEAIANYISGAARPASSAIYNKAVFYAERQRALEQWAAHLMGLPFG
jgi:hypothetical protein